MVWIFSIKKKIIAPEFVFQTMLNEKVWIFAIKKKIITPEFLLTNSV